MICTIDWKKDKKDNKIWYTNVYICYISVLKWSTTNRVLKPHRSKMGVICMYICNDENDVLPRLSPQWLCGRSCTWAHDVRYIHIPTYICIHIYIYTHIYMYVYIYIYIYIYTYIKVKILHVYISNLSNKRSWSQKKKNMKICNKL